MPYTVPDTPNRPMRICVGGREYFLQPGESVTIPDEVKEELLRALGIKHVPPDVEPPFVDAGLDAKLSARLTALETAVAAVVIPGPELPDTPGTDGTYSLQITVADGEATLSWEAVEAAASET